MHSCQVSQNGRDSPRIQAHVPAVSWLTQNSTYVPEFYKPCQAWAWSSNDSTCSLKENLMDVLEPTLDTILNTKAILELIFIVCHDTHLKLWPQILAEINSCGRKKGAWLKNSAHAPKMSRFLIPKLGNYDRESNR